MRVNWKKEWTTPAAVGVVSFAAGVGAGVLGYRWRIDRQVERDLESMTEMAKAGAIDEVNKTYEAITVEGFITQEFRKKLFEQYDKPTLDSGGIMHPGALDAHRNHSHGLAMDIPSSNGLSIVPDDEEDDVVSDSGAEPEAEESVIVNVFDNSWDEDAEAAQREPGKAYIIHQDQFFSNESGYRQSTLEFYEGDQILSDENNTPVYDGSNIADAINFGHGSQDPNTCYIRNDEAKGEYEVVRNTGFYQIEVVGLHAEEVAQEDELRHSNTIRRFKMD